MLEMDSAVGITVTILYYAYYTVPLYTVQLPSSN